MYENVKSLDDIIKKDKYTEIQKEINDFIRKVMKKNVGKIDTIIVMDRKGNWIIRDVFFNYPGLFKYNIISNYEITTEYVKNQKILIFDDSIHTGESIINLLKNLSIFSPKSIKIFCLLINVDAKKNIKKENTKIDTISCKPVFKKYSEQQKMYINWETTYLDGLRTTDNPDYPILKLIIKPSKIDEISKYLLESLEDIIPFDENDGFRVKSIADDRDSCSLSIDIKPDDLFAHSIYIEHIKEKDGCKIRCDVINQDDKTEIRLMPLINPRFVSTNCNITLKNPKICLHKIWETEKTDWICKTCIALFINYDFIREIQSELLPKLQNYGFLIETSKINIPPRFINQPGGVD